MTVVPAVSLVSLISVAASRTYFGDSSAGNASDVISIC